MKVLLASLLVFAGCATAVSDPMNERPGVSAVQHGHTCADACDHMFVDGGWKVLPGHRHGPGCGHVLVDGRWMNAKGAAEPGKESPPKDR